MIDCDKLIERKDLGKVVKRRNEVEKKRGKERQEG